MKISAIIPAYNRADLMDETLVSILDQTRPPDEVIVVDDGSTDGTADVVSKYGSRVALIRQENAGAGAARNSGFLRSTGDIVHFMDSDDISSLNTYALQAAAIEAGADMVYGPWIKTRFAGRMLHPMPCALQQRVAPGDRSLAQLVLCGQWVTVLQPCLFRRSLVEAAGPYRTDLKPSEDTEMLYRLTAKARSIVHTPKTILLYRVHPEGQVSVQNVERRRLDMVNLWAVMAEHAARRCDLERVTRETLRLRRIEAQYDLHAVDPKHHATLAIPRRRDVVRLRVKQALRRVDAKVRDLLIGDRSNRYFAPAPLTSGQKREIAVLGYEL